MKTPRNTKRFEVRHPVHGNLLGYVQARDIDHAYDQAAQRYHGADVHVSGAGTRTVAGVAV